MSERTQTKEQKKNNERSITNDWEREKQQTVHLTNDAAAAKYPITWQK